MCTCALHVCMHIHCWRGNQREAAIRFSSRQTVGRRGPEVLRGQSSAHPSEKHYYPGKKTEYCIQNKKGPKEPDIIEKRKKRADRTRNTDRGLSLISGRLVQEIRPLGKALYLAYLRLPVIIIKAVSPTATAEQSSHLERHPVRRKIKKDRTIGQKKDGYIKSNEQCKPNPMLC